jgi:hypothetical protein
MNSHISESAGVDLPADFIHTDAPDPRLALPGRNDPVPRLPIPAVKDTAAVTCAILVEQQGRWSAGLAFEQFYVSAAWVQELLNFLRIANLAEFASRLGDHWQSERRTTRERAPGRVALALMVCYAGSEEAHLICESGCEPPEWRSWLDSVLGLRSQHRFCGTLEYLSAFRGDASAAEWVAENFAIEVPEAT